MSSPSFIRTSDDSFATGKRVRTNTRVVGADTVHEHFTIPTYQHDITGVYYAHSSLISLLTAAHAASSGFLFLSNPVGSPVTIAVRRVGFQAAPTSTTTRPNTRITVERFTFTGTASGSIITAGKRQTADAAPTGSVRTASTGMTITPTGAVQRGFLVGAVPSGGGNTGSSQELIWTPQDTEGETLVAPGEGLLFRQADAGSAGEDRQCIFNITWLEY